MVENTKADYPWKFRWYTRKYQLISSEYIVKLRKAISEKRSSEDYNWGSKLLDKFYIVPDLSNPDIQYFYLDELINNHEKSIDKYSKKLTREDFMALPHIALAGINLNDTADIFKFVSNYGLLGIGDIIVSQIPLNIAEKQEIIKMIIEQKGIETYEDEEVLSYIAKGEYLDEYGEEMHFPMKFIKLTDSISIASNSLIRDIFFPLQPDLEAVNLPSIQTVLSIENTESILKSFTEIIKDSQEIASTINSFTFDIVHYYSEPLSLFKQHAEEYQSLYRQFNEFQNQKSSSMAALQIELAFKEHLKNVHPNFIFNWNQNVWEKGWQVGTMLEACYLLLYLDVAGGLNARYCNRCQTPFIATKEQHYYCSTQCQVNDKQRRYRERKKKQVIQ